MSDSEDSIRQDSRDQGNVNQANTDVGNVDRRTFISKSAAAIAGSAVLASSAVSYANILGANDRISLCHIGIGGRGHELDWIVSPLKTSHNAEMTTVFEP